MKLDRYLEKIGDKKTDDNAGVVDNLEEKDIVSTLEEAQDLIDKCNGSLTQEKIDDAKEFIILIADKIEEAKSNFVAAVND